MECTEKLRDATNNIDIILDYISKVSKLMQKNAERKDKMKEILHKYTIGAISPEEFETTMAGFKKDADADKEYFDKISVVANAARDSLS